MLFEEIGILVRGIILGVAIAAPVGPIGLLCIRRTVERGLATGLATGLGAAFADALFSSVAAFGITIILDTITRHQTMLRLVGGVFLLGVAVHSFLKEPRPPASQPEAGNLYAATASGLALTITNPVTIMGIFALVVGFGGGLTTAGATTLVVGIFLGSLLWWCVLCGGVSLIRHHFTARTVKWINRGTGIVLAAMGTWALASVAWT